MTPGDLLVNFIMDVLGYSLHRHMLAIDNGRYHMSMYTSISKARFCIETTSHVSRC